MASRKKTSDQAKSASDAESESEISFEDAMTRLGEIVEELEGGELSLEVSLQRFEEGVKLARRSQARLDDAEAKVEELLGFDDKGTPVTEEI